jgi:hypothetical protein
MEAEHVAVRNHLVDGDVTTYQLKHPTQHIPVEHLPLAPPISVPNPLISPSLSHIMPSATYLPPVPHLPAPQTCLVLLPVAKCCWMQPPSAVSKRHCGA